jgi:hypothetical protein
MSSQVHVSLGGHPVACVMLTIPYGGIWSATVDLIDEAAKLPTPTQLVIGGSTCVCAPSVQGAFALQRRVRVEGGYGGWRRPLPARGYDNDANVKASRVAQDAAQEAGEVIGSFAGGVERLGVDYARKAGLASTALDRAAQGATWWVGLDGVTHVGTRPTSRPPRDAYELLDYNAREQVAILGLEDLTEVGVGSILSDPRLEADVTVRGLEVTITPDMIRARAWCSPDGEVSPLADALKAIADRCAPGELWGKYRYRVISMTADRVNVQAVRKRTGLPDLLTVSMWPGAAGLHAVLAPGSECVVEFLDGDPGQPVITHFAGKDGVGHVPVSLSLCGGSSRVAAVGSTVTVFFPAIIPASGTLDGLPFVGNLTIVDPVVGIVEDGPNPKVLV